MKIFKDIYYICYRFIDRNISPIYYRFFGHKFHIVRTGLRPQAWHDNDTRILYAVMSIVKWFVENDMRIVSEVDYLKEVSRIANTERLNDNETLGQHLELWVEQYEAQIEILKIAAWWKNYDNRQKEISEALNNWADYTKINNNWEQGISFLNNRHLVIEEERLKERELSNKLHNLEDQLAKEEQEMLKKIIELRGYMWS
jgi:hypothetical protein